MYKRWSKTTTLTRDLRGPIQHCATLRKDSVSEGGRTLIWVNFCHKLLWVGKVAGKRLRKRKTRFRFQRIASISFFYEVNLIRWMGSEFNYCFCRPIGVLFHIDLHCINLRSNPLVQCQRNTFQEKDVSRPVFIIQSHNIWWC